MSRAKLVDYYVEKSMEEGFEIDQIRKELEDRKIPDEEIKSIVRLVDNHMQNDLLIKSHNSKSNELFWAGLALTIIGAAITIGTYTGAINMGDSFLFVYGPLFGGLSLMFGGWAKKRF